MQCLISLDSVTMGAGSQMIGTGQWKQIVTNTVNYIPKAYAIYSIYTILYYIVLILGCPLMHVFKSLKVTFTYMYMHAHVHLKLYSINRFWK